VLVAGVAPIAGIAALSQGCGSTTSGSDAGDDGGVDPDASAVTEVLHPDAPPLPGQSECVVTITTQIPVGKATHVPVCTPVTYATNPPSGGDHWGVWAAFTTYEIPVPREMYVHDMEHGAVLLLHDCDGACPEELLSALAAARDEVTGDPLCLQIPGGPTERVITTPDPLLDAPIAAAAWGATYTATCVDLPSLKAFAKAHYGHAPETICAQGKLYGADDGGAPTCDDAGTGGTAGSGGTGTAGSGGTGTAGSGGTGTAGSGGTDAG